MKNIGLVTDVAFWRAGLGKNARIYALYTYLARHSDLTLYYLGKETSPFPCKNAIHSQVQHDLIIVEYIHLHWITDLVKETPVYLDACDFLSQRAETFQTFHRTGNFPTLEQEIALFQKFDMIILLQKEEMETISRWIPRDRLLLCPHPVVPEVDAPIREKVETISFFGSPSWPNIDGIQWFHDAVLPLLGDLAQKCAVHGTFCSSPLSVFFPHLTKGEFFPSVGDYYKNVDIAINPVLYGSGLKIKTVEAMAYGIPLVTTSIGAQGLSDQSNRAFLCADTPEEFAVAIHKLVDSAELRRQISLQARAYAREHSTPGACFNKLIISDL